MYHHTVKTSLKLKHYGTDHLTCRGGGMDFCFIQNFFIGQHEIEYLFFLSHKARIFFPEYNIRLYDKNSETDFSSIRNQNICFEKNYICIYLFEGSNLPIPHLGTLRGPGSLPGWTFVQLDFDINVYKCKCCKLRTSIKKRARGQLIFMLININQ